MWTPPPPAPLSTPLPGAYPAAPSGALYPPAYPQPGAGYGAYAGPSGYAPYGQSAPPSARPPVFPPNQASTPPKNNRALLLGMLITVVTIVLVGAVITVAILAAPRNGPGGVAGATATPSARVVFQDSLATESVDNPWPSDSHCFYGADGYHVIDGYICYAPMDSIANATYSVQVAQVFGEQTWFYGLVIRRVSKGNYYSFGIASNGFWIFYKVVNGKSTDIQPYIASGAIHRGLNQKNTLSVTAQGAQFTFRINGEQVGSASDSTFGAGLCGVAGNSGGNVEVVFTNFLVTTPN